MLCVCRPPSDHDEKTYVEPPIVCGDGALIEFVEPITACFVSGAAPAISSMPTFAPVGFEATVRFMICGSTRTLVVAVAPVESVAVSWTSSQHGYSWSGALNEPLATPLNVWLWWLWQFDGERRGAARRRPRDDRGRRVVRAQELDPVDRAAVEVGVEEVAAGAGLDVDRARRALLEDRDLVRVGKAVRAGLHEPDAAARVV